MPYSILSKQRSISIPTVFLKRFYEVTKSFSSLNEELEDWLLSSDLSAVKKLKQARRDHIVNKVKPLSVLR